MESETVLRFTLLSGLIGFAAFCGSYAFQMWRRRNASIRNKGPSAFRDRLRVLFSLGMVLGGLGALLSLAVREVVRPVGLLEGNELVTVRARDDFDLVDAHKGPLVEQGEVLARFQNPEHATEVDQLRLRRSRLVAEQRGLELSPLEPDAELVRLLQNAITQRRQLQGSLDLLEPERHAALRAAAENSLSRKDQLARLEGELARLQGEQEKARNQQGYDRLKRQRLQVLAGRGATSVEEIEAQRKATTGRGIEIVNLEKQIDCLGKEQEQLEESIGAYKTLATGQARDLGLAIQKDREELAQVLQQEKELSAKHARDLERAKQLRAEEIRQIELRVRECDTMLAGLRERVVVHAPFAGRIWYRAPSPQSIHQEGPLLVLGPEHGAVLTVRIPRSQLDSLERSGDVMLRLVDAEFQHRFQGRFHRARLLPHEPDHAVAELHCVPPPEAVLDFVEGRPVRCELLWRPPIWSLWPFPLSVVVAGLSAVGWLACWRRGREEAPRSCSPLQRPGVNGAAPRKADVPAALPALPMPTPGGVEVEYGSNGALLRMLGGRLREVILRREEDPAVLGAVEWALDRHQARAVRVLADALNEEESLRDHVLAWYQQLDPEEPINGNGNGNGNAGHPPYSFHRLHAILRVIVPELIPVTFSGRPGARHYHSRH
jgi:hypothetical protein